MDNDLIKLINNEIVVDEDNLIARPVLCCNLCDYLATVVNKPQRVKCAMRLSIDIGVIYRPHRAEYIYLTPDNCPAKDKE